MDEHEQFDPAPSDSEFVEGVRRRIALLGRYRWAMVGFYGALAVAFVGFAVVSGQLLQGWLMPVLGPGFGVGLALGVMLGLLGLKIGYGLITALWGVDREMTLLVEYHDTLRSLANGRGGVEDAESVVASERSAGLAPRGAGR